MRYGSVCSGIESASVAWEPLGFKATWLAEIEAFPSAVLDFHWPEVTNLGDMNNLPDMVRNGEIEAPEILVGGTPCQAFSVAGKRDGLDAEGGQLSLTYIDLADAIDEKRHGSECIICWENVPGVLSSKDNAFGCFLGKLSGEDIELQPTGKRWSNAGCVFGTKRTIAWRILDAQYFGVAQRRRRVFVIASARAGFDPTRVLFESEGLRRDIKPSREARENTTSITGAGSHWDSDINPHPTLNQSNSVSGIGSSNQEVFAQRGSGLVPFDMTAFGQYGNGTTASTCKARDYKDATDLVVYPINDKATRCAGVTGKGSGNGLGVGKAGDPAPTMTTADVHLVCFAQNSRDELREMSYAGALSASPGMKQTSYVRDNMVVRRLTPVECERLQGFSDNHTQIPWRGKQAEDCPKGQRYKAIGNSKAVPVVRWIGSRILKEFDDHG